MAQITVIHKKKKISLPLKQNGNLLLASLKQYCPAALGLSYDKDGSTHGLELADGEIVINPNITNYDVYTTADDSPPRSSYPTAKRRRLDEILSKIHGGKENYDEELEEDEPLNVKQRRKSQKTLPKCVNRLKTLHVGWLHRTCEDKKYQQMKKPIGGIKDLRLKSTHEYSVDDIKKMAIKEFTSDENCKLMGECTIKFGSFDGHEIEEFEDQKGRSCGLWGYCKSRNISAYRLHLYLLTTLKIDDSKSEGVIEDETSCQDQLEANGAPAKEAPPVPDQREDVRAVYQSEDEVEDLQTSCQDEFGVTGASVEEATPVPDQRKDVRAVYQSEDEVEDLPASCQDEFGATGAPVEESPSVRDQRDDVRVFYHYIKESRYTGAKSIVELEKQDLYLKVLSEQDFPELTIDEFEPLNQGYDISRVEKSGKVLLQIDLDENLRKSFSFPSADDGLPQNNHIIVHDVDELQGCCEGQFGLGIIPNCTDSCKPFFTWMKNGIVYKEGYFLYWISVEPQEPDDTHTWSVTVHCQKSTDESVVSDSTQMGLINTADQLDTPLPAVSTIPSIMKEDLIISKIILGAGAQGIVRRGNWLGKDVAIKTVKLMNANSKLISRELDVLNIVEHPNIIQMMATCLEPRQLHIVMEFFESNPLSDVLFDDDIKEEYNLSIEKKNFIGQQICKAVSYLHCQPNAIIHGDIKPDNILLNMDGIVKICDLGLSKSKQMATALRSTIGVNTVRGTPMFMAPEMVLEKRGATISSDVWALACTLIELYSSTPVWNLDGDDQLEDALKEKLISKSTPDLTAVPNELRSILKSCFSHTISERPTAVDLQKMFTTLL